MQWRSLFTIDIKNANPENTGWLFISMFKRSTCILHHLFEENKAQDLHPLSNFTINIGIIIGINTGKNFVACYRVGSYCHRGKGDKAFTPCHLSGIRMIRIRNRYFSNDDVLKSAISKWIMGNLYFLRLPKHL